MKVSEREARLNERVSLDPKWTNMHQNLENSIEAAEQ